MFKGASLPVKVFITFFPLFFATVAIISYINYSTTQEEMLIQVQNAATAQANTIREALVNMMITNERVEDIFLRKIASAGDIKNISILFKIDSLHLEEEYYDDSARIHRLMHREAEVWKAHAIADTEIFSYETPHWYLLCSRKIHDTQSISNLSSNTPAFIHTCEEMQAIVPFRAEKKCLECHQVNEGKVLGAAVMSVPLKSAAVHLQDNAKRSLYIFFGFIAIALVVNAFVFRKFINSPLKKLLRALEEIGKGRTHMLQGSFESNEFGMLAVAFERMQENLERLKEEALKNERLSALGQMASSIVHDFRAPMTNLSLTVEQLQNHGSLAPERRERMFVILHESIQRIDKMMQELLDYSKGVSSLQLSDCKVEEIAQTLHDELGFRFQNSAIQFSVTNLCKGTAALDKELFLRALHNLINNAEDAIPNGGSIAVEIGGQPDCVVFTIRDNGKGIPKEIHNTLFEPFVSFGKKKGTGLGLASVKRAVELHKGTITFSSEEGTGTAFILTIPRTATD